VAFAVSALILGVYPVFATITDTEVRLQPDWIWLLVGGFALHGMAEELVWRGYTFRRVREGRAFWPAVLTVPLLALAAPRRWFGVAAQGTVELASTPSRRVPVGDPCRGR